MVDQQTVEFKAWLKRHGVESVAEAQGEPVVASERYFRKGSEMADTLVAEIKGDKVLLSGPPGWASEFCKDEFENHIDRNGKLSTWDDFQKLAGLKSKDVS